MDLTKIFTFNPFAKFFRDARGTEELKRDVDEIQNSQGASDQEMNYGGMGCDGGGYQGQGGNLTYTGIQFEQYFANKASRIAKYREMAMFPEIADGLDNICDEAIIDNAEGEIVALEITEEMPEHVEEEIRKNWNYLVNDVYYFNEIGWDLFRRWLIEAELYIELILNDEGDNIIGIKILPAHTMMPVYEDDYVAAYMQTNVAITDEESGTQTEVTTVTFDKDQVVYSNFGLTGDNALDVRGFLDSSIRVYNQLRNLEDSLVIYRLVRAPERRVWNVYTGRMPKGKSEEYMKHLIQRYKKRIVYDSNTGAMNSAQNVQALTEDFWFARNEDGQGTTVDTIGGGMNLGELDDVNYFLQKLYKTLKLPKSRWEDASNSMFSPGKSGEITREEIRFSRFVERLQRRFKYILVDAFLTLLKLKGIDEMYIQQGFYNVSFVKSNLFKEYKELELLESRFSLLSSINEFIYDKEDNPKGFFSKEYSLKKYFLMTDEEFAENNEMIRDEMGKVEVTDVGGDEDEGGFGDEEGEDEDLGGETDVPETPEDVSAKEPEEEAPEEGLS